MRAVACVALGSLFALPVVGGAELVLEDGQRLAGRSVERKGDLYLLRLDTDRVLPIPVELVIQLRLTGEDAPAPTGLKDAEPRTLAGRPDAAELPPRYVQTEALGEPAAFRAGVIDPVWRPRSDWDSSSQLNNFNPARWYTPPLDPSWRPVSAYKAANDVTEFNPARWYKAPLDPTWWPTDGFTSREPWFRRSVSDR